jgi:hypothetical protein
MASCNRIRHLLCGGFFIPSVTSQTQMAINDPSDLTWLKKYMQPQDPTQFASIAHGPRELMKSTGFADRFFGLSDLAPEASSRDENGADQCICLLLYISEAECLSRNVFKAGRDMPMESHKRFPCTII